MLIINDFFKRSKEAISNQMEYLLDKTVQITVSIVGFIIAILMLNAFKVENDLKIALTIKI